MRDDVAAPGLDHEVALGNAGAVQDEQFKIPPILGGDDQ
jgi:Asp-tRNA(Asn)/Glu-tRNA(Gln) amidotransferase C subunit